MFFNLIFMVYILFSFPIAISFKMGGTYLVSCRIASSAQVTLLWYVTAVTSLTLVQFLTKPSYIATTERAGLTNFKVAV